MKLFSAILIIASLLSGCSNYSVEDYQKKENEWLNNNNSGVSSAEWLFTLACDQVNAGNLKGAIDSFYEAFTAGEELAQLELASLARTNAEGLENYWENYNVMGCS